MKCEQPDMFSPKVNGGPPVIIELRGHIPSFKNNKLLIPPSLKALGAALLRMDLQAAIREFNLLKKKRTFLITKPEYQREMEQLSDSIVSQLRSASKTACGPTCPESSTQSWIAWSMPDDDCWARIPEIHIKAEHCPSDEGATITIERIK